MRELVISTARHLAGAAAAAVVGLLGSQTFLTLGDSGLTDVSEGVEALVFGASLGAYALVEKTLKPLFRKYLGSTGE